MSQSKKVEQSKLTQLDESIETSIAVVRGNTKELLQSTGEVVWTSEAGTTPKKKADVADKMAIAFANDFSEVEDLFLRFAEEKG